MAGLTDLFVDTIRETSETQLGGDKGYLNLVQLPHYTSVFLMGGRTPEEMFRTSQTIRKTLYLSEENVGQRFGGAGLRMDFQNVQIGTKVTTQMSYYANHIAWDEVEIDLNADSDMGREAIRARFHEIITGKLQNLAQSHATTFENEKWAAADQAAMRTNFTAPMSLPYFITEQDNGLPLQADNTAMTDVLGLAPATYPKWDNTRVSYGALGGDDADGGDLIGALIFAAQKTHFEPLPIKPEHGVMESAPNVVFCSNDGLRKVQAAIRAGVDQWGRRELDVAYGLTLGNMVIRNVTTLDSAALYKPVSGSALATEATADLTGPRFWGVSKKAFMPSFMKDRMMKMEKPVNLTAIGAPNEWVQVCKTYNQLLCWDRSKSFIVSPSTDL